MSTIPMPPAAGPDPGQPGHFAHHDWLEQSVLALDAGGGVSVPAPGSAYGNGVNQIAAVAWANLPSTPLTFSIDTPATLWCILNYSAWIAVTAGAGDCRMSVALSGATVVAPNGVNGATDGTGFGWGDILYAHSATGTGSVQVTGTRWVRLNPGVTRFDAQAYKSASGVTCQVNYPVMRVMPLRAA